MNIGKLILRCVVAFLLALIVGCHNNSAARETEMYLGSWHFHKIDDMIGHRNAVDAGRFIQRCLQDAPGEITHFADSGRHEFDLEWWLGVMREAGYTPEEVNDMRNENYYNRKVYFEIKSAPKDGRKQVFLANFYIKAWSATTPKFDIRHGVILDVF